MQRADYLEELRGSVETSIGDVVDPMITFTDAWIGEAPEGEQSPTMQSLRRLGDDEPLERGRAYVVMEYSINDALESASWLPLEGELDDDGVIAMSSRFLTDIASDPDVSG